MLKKMKAEKMNLEILPFELVEKLMALKGHPFGQVKFFGEYEGLSGGKKTLALFGGKVYKYFRAVAMTNVQYENAVNNRLIKSGADAIFQAQQHKWMDRYITEDGELTTLGFHRADKGLPLSERRWYLVLYFTSPSQIFESVYYDADLREINKDLIKPHLPSTESKTQSDAGLSENQVIFRTAKIENIREITIGGEVISVVNEVVMG
jgi:hypothetical protein